MRRFWSWRDLNTRAPPPPTKGLFQLENQDLVFNWRVWDFFETFCLKKYFELFSPNRAIIITNFLVGIILHPPLPNSLPSLHLWIWLMTVTPSIVWRVKYLSNLISKLVTCFNQTPNIWIDNEQIITLLFTNNKLLPQIKQKCELYKHVTIRLRVSQKYVLRWYYHHQLATFKSTKLHNCLWL